MKKKILYIHQYFRLPHEPGGNRSYWIAQEFVNSGYEVTILSHRNVLLDFVKQKKIVDIQYIQNMKVIYVKNKYSNSMNTFQRSYSFLKFMLYSTIYALKEKDVTLVYATSTPLTVAIPALVRKFLKKTPYIFEVRDLWPEGPIQLAVIKNGLVIAALKWFEKITYRYASHIIALSPGMQDGVMQYVDKTKISMVPNMAKTDKFWPRDRDAKLEKEIGLSENSFRVIYFGQMGESNAIPYLISMLQLVKNLSIQQVEFLFIGHGKYFNKLYELSLDNEYSFVKVLKRRPMNELSEIINLFDVSLVTFSDIPILKTNSPNKLFDSLSSGIAVIVNSDGWTRNLIVENNCGLYADPKNAEDLLEKILYLKSNPDKSSEFGKNARNLAQNRYDKSILVRQIVDVVNIIT